MLVTERAQTFVSSHVLYLFLSPPPFTALLSPAALSSLPDVVFLFFCGLGTKYAASVARPHQPHRGGSWLSLPPFWQGLTRETRVTCCPLLREHHVTSHFIRELHVTYFHFTREAFVTCCHFTGDTCCHLRR